jgi:MFS family permease
MLATSAWLPAVLSVALFVGILIAIRLGQWYGRRISASHDGGDATSLGVLDGALFGLLGLVIAFTFGGALTRFEARRDQITREANAIGTAYLRLDLLREPARSEARTLFRQYLSARIGYHRNRDDPEKAVAMRASFESLQGEIWSTAVKACETESRSEVAMLTLGALNEMIDMTTWRLMALINHPPMLVFAMLFSLSVACGFISGFTFARSKSSHWVHGVGFALLTSLWVFAILELEYPRGGFVRIDDADVALTTLRASMK